MAIDRAVDLLGQMTERHEMGRGGYRQSSRFMLGGYRQTVDLLGRKDMRWGEVAIDRAVDLLGQMRERHEMGRRWL